MRVVDNYGFIASKMALAKMSAHYQGCAAQPKSVTAEPIKAVTAPTTTAAPAAATTKTEPNVSISREALLRQRMTERASTTNDGTANARSQSVAARTAISRYESLSADDRQLLGSVYSYAKQHGADLNLVDKVAFNLADRRLGKPAENEVAAADKPEGKTHPRKGLLPLDSINTLMRSVSSRLSGEAGSASTLFGFMARSEN